eukprot:CAMPEP_0167740516 /NCGR_PEP_ID=MMETSP0110_2-20121227/323_1 /TAXON_ID=629695 /ORGANISM="Gymnochlora sp., Strain CCMP2014" /LENGTH=219 /DNA_ID=CAMNT_0007624423 /DNA_START=410 /DNA_END=1066 /DNA_ORIENTATION=-
MEDYRPLINDVLIRVRTELCVLESFARETAFPFIQKKGLGWILPVRETSETYVAGVVFVVGANFILLGSTKVLAILSIYHDILLGFPMRTTASLLEAISLGGEGRAVKQDEKRLKNLMEEQLKEVSKTLEKDGDVAAVNAKYAGKIEEIKKKRDERVQLKKERSGQTSKIASGVSVPLRLYGEVSLGTKRVLEAFDTFCSRYLVATTVVYTILKSVHFW